MSSQGPQPPQDDEDFLAYVDAGLNAFEIDFGADIVKECFPIPNSDEQPSALLWLANKFCEGAASVIESVSVCYRRPKVD
ncbi:MAG: hypothetical protein AB7I18_08025 [Candidatus Berkiella sp.]